MKQKLAISPKLKARLGHKFGVYGLLKSVLGNAGGVATQATLGIAALQNQYAARMMQNSATAALASAGLITARQALSGRANLPVLCVNPYALIQTIPSIATANAGLVKTTSIRLTSSCATIRLGARL